MAFSKTQHRLSSRDRLSSIHKRNIFILKILLGIFLFIAFNSLLLSTVLSESISMEPALENGARSIYHPVRNVHSMERGDVVLIEAPYYEKESIIVNLLNRFIGFLTFQKVQISFYPREGWINRYMVKRIVALPGDTVKMEDWIIHIKTQENRYYLSEFECSEKDYDVYIEPEGVKMSDGDPLSGNLPELTLNEGEYFVLGDNRKFSNDSYYWGILPEDNIKGKLFFVYWPLSNFGVIH